MKTISPGVVSVTSVVSSCGAGPCSAGARGVKATHVMVAFQSLPKPIKTKTPTTHEMSAAVAVVPHGVVI